jgi:hypothetical protein
MVRKVIVIPRRFIRIAPKQRKTIALQNTQTGLFEGRELVKGRGDMTNAVYLSQDRDLDKDGKISSKEHGGTILGRTEKDGTVKTFSVRASGRAKGYEKRV